MKRKYKIGEVKFTFSGVEGRIQTLKNDVLVYWAGRKQFYSTLSPAFRACVLTKLFQAGLIVQ